MIYLTISYKYNEYIINTKIEKLYETNKNIDTKIKEKKEEIAYKSSTSYKNRILKEDEQLKNKWEKVISLISEEKLKIYTSENENTSDNSIVMTEYEQKISTMTIFQKWIFFLFNKDIKGY